MSEQEEGEGKGKEERIEMGKENTYFIKVLKKLVEQRNTKCQEEKK